MSEPLAAQPSRESRALLALLCGACCIGLAPVFPKLAIAHDRALLAAHPGEGEPLGLIAAAFWRVALATLLLLPLHRRARMRGRSLAEPPLDARTIVLLLVPGLGFAGDMALWHASFEYTTVANATLLTNCATLLVALFGYLALGERYGPGLLLGAVIALAGAAVLLGVDFAAGSDPVRGDLLALGSAIFYGIYLIGVKQLRTDHGALRVMTWSTATCACALLPIVLFTGEGLVPQDASGWMWLFALAVVAHVGGQGLIVYGLAHLPASFAPVALLVQPVVAAAVCWPLFDQRLSSVQLLGGFAVLAGIALARRATPR